MWHERHDSRGPVGRTRTSRLALFSTGDCLRFRAPAGTLSPNLRAALSVHKDALLALVAAAPRCLWCHAAVLPVPYGDGYRCRCNACTAAARRKLGYGPMTAEPLPHVVEPATGKAWPWGQAPGSVKGGGRS